MAETASRALAFDEATHTYSVDGQQWPSVTAILDPLLELDGIPRAALEAAALFGTHVHLATHLWDLGQLDEEALDSHLRPYLAGWKAFLRESGAVVLQSELRVHHSRLRYAGTLDKIVRWKQDRRYVLDVKSSAVVPWTVGMQTAGYLEALSDDDMFSEVGETLSTTRLCVHLKPEGVYRLHVLKDSRDRNDFISTLNFHHLRMRHARQSR